MGLSAFNEALEAKSLGFVRPNSLFGYAGNGAGISSFVMHPGAEKPFSWCQTSIFGAMEDAPELQLRRYCPSLNRAERTLLVSRILQNSRQLDWDNAFFKKNVIQEANDDIATSPTLTSFVFAHEPAVKRSVNLYNLSGIDKNGFRIPRLKILDGIDLILRVAEINLELAMGYFYDQADLGTSWGAETLLREKIKRFGATPQLLEQFQSLLDLENIPDIRPAVASGDLSLPEIWKIRQGKKARRFREWLRAAGPGDARDLERAYVAALGNPSHHSSLPVRVLRFVLTTAAGAVQPVLGALAGVTDSFFVDKWLAGYSPRLFLDQIRQLPGTGCKKDD